MVRPRVVHVAAEHTLSARTGGLGEAVAGMARGLARRGIDVDVLVCATRAGLERPGVQDALEGPQVDLPSGPCRFSAHRIDDDDGVRVHLLTSPGLFDRDELYGPPGGEYGDNPQRFAAFAQAAAAWILRRDDVRVAHLHDWHTGLAAPLLTRSASRPRIVFTAHNAAYQGDFDMALAPWTGLGPAELGFDGAMHHDRVNPLKAGVQFADAVTTVSPTHATELRTPEGGFGLDAAWRWRAAETTGVLNGIDPLEDPPSAAERASGRAALCQRFGLQPPTGPLFGAVARLSHQKGIDLLADAAPAALEAGAALLVLGSGDAALAADLRHLEATHPSRVAFCEAFDPTLAASVFRGCDALVVPSRFEPCGLVQMHAMHAGTIPVVRAVGGLADSVRDADDDGWGVVFRDPTADALAEALRRCAAIFASPVRWQALQDRARSQRFDWDRAAARYAAIYERAPTATAR